MEAAFGNLQSRRLPKNGRTYLLSLSLAILLLACLIGGSFHHHHDLRDHPDCVICILTHHAPAETGAPALPAGCPLLSQILSTLPILAVVITCWIGTRRGRAPPF